MSLSSIAHKWATHKIDEADVPTYDFPTVKGMGADYARRVIAGIRAHNERCPITPNPQREEDYAHYFPCAVCGCYGAECGAEDEGEVCEECAETYCEACDGYTTEYADDDDACDCRVKAREEDDR